jgi:hypothetical protein
MAEGKHMSESEKKDPDISVVVSTAISFQTIADTMCSAVEGGSNYWCEKLRTKDQDKFEHWYADKDFYANPDFSFTVYDGEADRGKKKKVVGRAELERGLKVMAEKYPHHFADMIAENGDANTGDILLQCMAFGEVVYG